jgi:hypothetical protein
MEFSGKVSATATARSRGGDLSAKVGLALREGNAKLAEDTGDIQGVEASLSLNLLPIVASDPHQTLRFASARVGKVALGRGLVSFRLDSADELFVEEAHVGWYGGELDTYALRFDAKRSDLSAVVYARDVDAGKLLEVFPGVKGTGDGRLHGRLPVFRKAGRYGYGTGYLYSVPGEKGHLEVTELGPLLPAMGRMGAQGEMIAGALRNFDYDLFRVDIRPEGSKDQGIRMRLEGNEKGAENTPPLRLDVNVLGAIEEALNVGMELGSAGKTLENFSKLQSFLRKSIE